MSPGEPRRQGPCQTCLFDGFESKYGLVILATYMLMLVEACC
ncbi:hypothetical protein A2U01_0090995 [Trifolium medium]|uniref:Uncharacterized protein n=1 Tax=Trifolium medium TaxID=97028 RepID=A0A392U8M6_9FABA|nr:hypothetical protein [Trifolium medium]